jgi:uncharacterized protein
MTDFKPAWYLRNRHLQTIWGRIVRKRRLVAVRREVIETPDGDELHLDHVDAPGSRLRIIFLHGLEGSSNSVYAQGILSLIRRAGLQATVLNFRSCALDQTSFRSIPNRGCRLYHSGETTDFDFLVRLLRARDPEERLAAVGVSLGGNVLLKWLGENPEERLLERAVAISAPLDLAAGDVYLRSLFGRLYVSLFVRTLIPKAERIIRDFPSMGEVIDLERARRARTFREFDDAATAPLHGFADAADYYEKSSAIRVIDRITTPTLCINALDDPFLPAEALERARRLASPAVTTLFPTHGGHVGFIAGSLPWRPRYWAEEIAVDWCKGIDSTD